MATDQPQPYRDARRRAAAVTLKMVSLMIATATSIVDGAFDEHNLDPIERKHAAKAHQELLAGAKRLNAIAKRIEREGTS